MAEFSGPAPTEEADSVRDDVRTRIVAAAIHLLTKGGRDALTTRAVAAAAGVQAPTLYRLFGDKRGLLDAVAEHGFVAYLNQKTAHKPSRDPVEDLRTGWDLHVEFGLAHPALYSLMYGDPHPGLRSPAAEIAKKILEEHIRQIAVAGRLRVSEEKAVDLVHAAGCGTVFTLLAMPVDCRDQGLSRDAREAVLTAITTNSSALKKPGPEGAAVALRAALPDAKTLTEGERHLLGEWLERIATSR